MKGQYEVELVFIRLIIKRNLLSESILRISLIQSSGSLTPQSKIRQTQQLTLRKNHKIIELDSMVSFKFYIKQPIDTDSKLIIKYQIKGTGEERVRSIPIDSQKIINAFENQNKSSLQETFGGENAELLFKFYIKKNQQQEQQNNVAAIGPEDQQNFIGTRRSNSISRSKRPPNLNLSKKNKISQHQQKQIVVSPTSTLGYKMQKQKIMRDVQKQSSIVDSPLQPHKKASAIPISEIQKVNILITTHHRPKQSYGAHISYKIKIVFAMIILGIIFLAYDTFSDKTIRNKKKVPRRAASQSTHHVSKNKKKH